MHDEIDGGASSAPVWPAFADLMSVVLGAFVLILVGVIGMQLQLTSKLEEAVRARQQEAQQRKSLEQALAGPLAAGRVTLVNGRIGISGNVLFALNSDQLQPAGRDLLKTLAAPLGAYLKTRDEILMIRLRRRPAGACRQPPVRGQLGTVGQARVDGHACADRRRRAGVVGVRGRVRLRAAGQLECGR